MMWQALTHGLAFGLGMASGVCAVFLLALSLRHSPDDELTRIIAETCRAGGGHWQDPAPGGPIGRPATHLFEIQLFGQTAIGMTPEEAAHNWRKAALYQSEAGA